MSQLPHPRRRPARAARQPQRRPELGLPSWLDPTRIPPYDTSTRVSPPLRTDEDIEALIEGLRDGDRRNCDRPRAAPAMSINTASIGWPRRASRG
ncbi:MAG: hypothetical protein U0Z44_14585 [Kouleothrix sp.]